MASHHPAANPSSSARITLGTYIQRFCEAFISSTMPPTQMLDTFFSSDPSITEHGPSWVQERLPYAGITFRGRREAHEDAKASSRTCDDYFALLGATLSLQSHKESLPTIESYAIDLDTTYRNGKERSGAVLVKANARLASVKHGKGWDEDFVFVFSDFTENGKIGCMEIWADTLSAWMAVGE